MYVANRKDPPELKNNTFSSNFLYDLVIYFPNSQHFLRKYLFFKTEIIDSTFYMHPNWERENYTSEMTVQ